MKHGHRFLFGALLSGVLAAALTLIILRGQGVLAVDSIVYVDADATGENDGTSWEDAYTTLQPALEDAAEGDQIWVAAGTYTPTYVSSPGDLRSATFQMKNGVAIYGGFDPTAGDTGWEDRDWVGNVAILSGELGNPGSADNSYHVFYHPLELTLDGSAILDGFTVSGGNADGAWPDYLGGGMANWYSSSPTVANCTFSDNSARYGGGMENAGSPTVTNCTFSNNSATTIGGGMHNLGSSPVVTDCTFSDNSADEGGGMYNEGASPVVINCTFSGNSAAAGGGMKNSGSSPVVTNCTFSGNSAVYQGGGMYNYNSAPAVTNCILWSNGPDEISNEQIDPAVTYSDIQGGYEGEGNIDEDPRFVDPDSGDFHLWPNSPCIDAADSEAPYLPEYDFEGDDRILDGDRDGEAIVDMGVDEAFWYAVYLPLALKGY